MASVSTVAAVYGLGAAALAVGLMVLLHVLEPKFDPSWWMLSEYSLGRYGVLMRVAFLAMGAIVAAHRAQRQSAEYASMVAAYSALWRGFDTASADLAPRARAVRARALVLRGALDPIISAGDARRATDALGAHGALEVVLPDAGHLPFLQQPGAAISAINGLIETVEAG